jgi:hypothetical protein
MISPKIKELRGTKNIDRKWAIYKETFSQLIKFIE